MDNITYKHVRYIGAALITSLGAALEGALSLKSKKDMVDEMNKYNDPAQQIKRLRSAGINPAYLLGQGVGSLSGNQEHLPAGQDFNIVSPAINAEAIRSQTDLNKATANKLESETNLNDADLRFRDLLNKGKLDFLDAETQEKLKQIDLDDATIKNLSAQYDKCVAEKDALLAQKDVLRATANKLDAETALTQLRQVLEQKLADSEIAKNNAAIAELASACYANTKRGDLDALQGAYQEVVNKYANKTESIKQQKLQSEKQKLDAEKSRIESATNALDLQNERTESGQWLRTFAPFAGLTEVYQSVGQVFGASASVPIRVKE